MNLKINWLVFFGLIVVMISCSVLKKSEGIVIKGNYEIVKTEKLTNNLSHLVCIIYDKQKNVPITDAIVEVNELKIGGFTRDDGTLELDLPAGKYTITVFNAQNSIIKTNLINIKKNTKTFISFKLGTTIIDEKR